MLSQRENLLHFPAWLGWVDNNVSVACKLDGLDGTVGEWHVGGGLRIAGKSFFRNGNV